MLKTRSLVYPSLPRLHVLVFIVIVIECLIMCVLPQTDTVSCELILLRAIFLYREQVVNVYIPCMACTLSVCFCMHKCINLGGKNLCLTFSILLCIFGQGKSVNSEGPLCVSVCALWQR
jgi:hypothetical protein